MTSVNYELYKIFYYVALNKSISKAATSLYISQPAVSQAIKNLEEQLGGQLLIRTKKGITLNDEGNIFFQYIKKGIENFQNGENAFLNYLNLDSGSIRIGASTTISRYILMPYLEKFHKKFPKVDTKIINHLSTELVTLLRNGDVDLVILNLPMKDHKDLKILPLLTVQDLFVGNAEYFQKTKGCIKVDELQNYPLITQKEPSNTRNFLNAYLKKNQVPAISNYETVSYGLVIDFVKAGFGIGYATKEFILDDLKKQELFEIKVLPQIPKREIGVVLLNKSVPNYSTKKLLEIMGLM